jgi:hypothetical protein
VARNGLQSVGKTEGQKGNTLPTELLSLPNPLASYKAGATALVHKSIRCIVLTSP